MEFGVHLPHMGHQAGREHLLAFAREAEALGFDSAWVSDHIAWPRDIASRYPYNDSGDFPAPTDLPWLDPLGTLLFIAAATERMRLGTSVLILGYRPPIQAAKLIATLDALSQGRFILGAGVGWMREEFEILGMPFDHRGARADEQLQLFEALFGQEHPAFEGRFYRFPAIGFSPRPASGRIPVWVGGHTEAAFERAAKYGDGLHAAFQDVPVLKEHIARAHAACERLGRDPATLLLSVRLNLDFDGVADPQRSISGSEAAMAERIGAYRELGVRHMVFDVVARGPGARLDAIRRFAALRPRLA